MPITKMVLIIIFLAPFLAAWLAVNHMQETSVTICDIITLSWTAAELTGVNILSCDPLGDSFQQKKIELKLVHKQKS